MDQQSLIGYSINYADILRINAGIRLLKPQYEHPWLAMRSRGVHQFKAIFLKQVQINPPHHR